MTLEQQAEEILLESDETLATKPSEDTFNKVSAQLVQIQKWKRCSLGAQILDDKFLFVKSYQRGRSAKYWYNLMFADPVPKRHQSIDWRWGLASLVFFLNAAGLLAIEHYYQLSARFVYFNSITVVLVTLGLIGFLMMIYKAKNALVFHTLHGQMPILSLAVNNPSKEEYQSFAKSLRQCIEQLQQRAHKVNNQLAKELGEHRRLKDENVVSEQEYEKAKNRILSQH